jgi:hypothetical protein
MRKKMSEEGLGLRVEGLVQCDKAQCGRRCRKRSEIIDSVILTQMLMLANTHPGHTPTHQHTNSLVRGAHGI